MHCNCPYMCSFWTYDFAHEYTYHLSNFKHECIFQDEYCEGTSCAVPKSIKVNRVPSFA